MFTIEKDVPIDAAAERRGRPASYPFKQMDVGDSFEFDGGEEARRKVVSAFSNWGRGRGVKFCTKRIGEGTFRCWRIK